MPAPRSRTLTVAFFATVLPISVSAQDSEQVLLLDNIKVTATPFSRSVSETAQSTTVLNGAALEREQHNSIGETLTRQPGVNNASFGGNVGRPVIRGFQGARVGVLNNNMSSADASSLSQDHAVPTEPFLLDQVEVLRGPATLMYGSGSIGGVVNMVSGAIPLEVPENGFDGQALLRGDSAANERFGATRLNFGSGSFAANVSAFYRRTDDYDIPGRAELFPEDGDEEPTGVLENSFVDNEGGSIGGSWIGDRWRAGLSYSLYDSDYGIPGAHAHHEEEEEHEGEEHGEEEEELVTIGLENRRMDGVLVGDDPFVGMQKLKLNIAYTDYEHTEFEGEEVGTVFEIDTTDGRLELQHNPIGAWIGTFGGQYTDRDFSALGEEAFVPPSVTKTGALFWVESAEFDRWRLDLGARYESTETETDALKRDFEPFSFSASAVLNLTESSHLVLTFADAERAPNDAELFSDGPHIATQTFEIGDPSLETETNRHYEIGYRVNHGNVSGSIAVYYDDFEDYIFLAGTGREEDDLPVRQWSQQGAEFTGGEIEARWNFAENSSGRWELFGFYDQVNAEFADGSNVPLIPPQRFGLGIDWERDGWDGNVTWIRADDHTDAADFETSTPGYDLLNAERSYTYVSSNNDITFYLKGQNLLDEDVRNSTSFLKDQAPQSGRNFIIGGRITF